MDTLKAIQLQPSSGRYVFPDWEGEPMGSIKTAFIKARTTAGICAKSRFNDLRQTFGSRCAQFGMNVMTIKELMGHASVTPTMRYMHVGEDHRRRSMREAVAKWQLSSDAIVKEAIAAAGLISVTA